MAKEPTVTRNLVSAGFFVLRAPLLSINELERIIKSLSHSGLDEAEDGAQQELRTLCGQEEVKEAIYVASSSFSRILHRWLEGEKLGKARSVKRAAIRYLHRMAGRTTPFGLFGTYSVGRLGKSTKLQLETRKYSARKTSLSLEFIDQVARKLERIDKHGTSLRFSANRSIYRVGNRLRFFELKGSAPGSEAKHFLTELEFSDPLDQILKAATENISFSRLVGILTALGYEPVEAISFLGELIDSQLLISELKVRATRGDALDALCRSLREARFRSVEEDPLEDARSHLLQFDSDGIGVPPSSYENVRNRVSAIGNSTGQLFDVSLRRSAKLSLTDAVFNEVRRGIDVLHKLSSEWKVDPLAPFRAEFKERYGERPASLLEVLDEDIGIGLFPREASNEAPAIARVLTSDSVEPDVRPLVHSHRHLLSRISEAFVQGQSEVVLTLPEISSMSVEEPDPLPSALAATFVISAASEEYVKAGDFLIWLKAVTGPSGVQMFGRFCDSDLELRRLVREHLKREETLEPDVIFAEIAHIPNARDGAIILRPPLRSYEIEIDVPSRDSATGCLPVSDLVLLLDGERLVLWSKTLKREIRPRLTSAHNFPDRGMNLYRFLGLMQFEGVSGDLAWQWGPLEACRSLPRVRIGRVVLARARWNLDRGLAESLIAVPRNTSLNAVTEIRRTRQIPRWVVIGQQKGELMVDLASQTGVDLLREAARVQESVNIVEMFPDSQSLCVRGPEGRFVHEIIAPFVSTFRHESSTRRTRQAFTTNKQQSFPPGSDWLFLKIYGTPRQVEEILLKHIKPLVDELLLADDIRKWFFVRYGDPSWHLRVRVNGDPVRLLGTVMPAIGKLLTSRAVNSISWRSEIATYDREIARYGGPLAIELAEEAFFHDSEAVSQLILQEEEDQIPERWRFACLGVDWLFDDYGMDLTSRLRLLRQVREGLIREMQIATARTYLGRSFRQQGDSVRHQLSRSHPDETIQKAHGILKNRSHHISDLFRDLRRLAKDRSLTTSPEDIMASFAHMHINRLLRAGHRASELLVYDFLHRIYMSQMERDRQ